MFKIGDKIKMIKTPENGWYGEKSNPVKVGDVLTIETVEKSVQWEYSFLEIDGFGWIGIEECFISIREDREKKLERILYENQI